MEQHGYTVIRALGQGGCQSRVYEVRDAEGRLRVLKQLPWMREEDREQAMREVRMLSSLRHPCIVPYLENFLVRSTPSMPSEDILCLVMHRCERDLRQECLRRRLEWELDRDEASLAANQEGGGPKTGARFEEQQVLSWLAQLCWGLQHLHARKFLHRDLKPQNVLLQHSGRRALLADFGVAGQVEHTEDLRHSIVGTPAFMSPEMLEGRPYGLKTDQWALGCVLFEMMALEPPFANCGESYAAVVGAVLHASPMSAPPGYSQALSETAEALLARKPHARPSNRELLRGTLRGPFHAFLQSLNQAAAAVAHVERMTLERSGVGGMPPTQRIRSVSQGPSSTSVSSMAPPTAQASPLPTIRGGLTPILTPSDIGSPDRKGAKGVGICGLPATETDVVSYASDFESMSESPLHSAQAIGLTPDFSLIPPPAAAVLGGDGSLSVRSDLSISSSPTEVNITSMGTVGLATGEWRQLLAEAEALLQPPLEEAIDGEDARAEAAKLRASLNTTLGGRAQVDKALGFLRERRPLGDTAEADELLLQVELLDILGDDGLHALPHLERLLMLESTVPNLQPLDAQANWVPPDAISFSRTNNIELADQSTSGSECAKLEAAVAQVTSGLEPLMVPELAGTGSIGLADLEDVIATFTPSGAPGSLLVSPSPLLSAGMGFSPLACSTVVPELLN